MPLVVSRLVTHAVQESNCMSAAGVCRIVACILHNDKLVDQLKDLDLSLAPSDCVRHDTWQREGLVMPPPHVLLQGWTSVLKFLSSKVHNASERSHAASPASRNFPKIEPLADALCMQL